MSWIVIRHASSLVLWLFCAVIISACSGSVAQEAATVEVIAEHGVGDGHPATGVPIGRVTDIAVDTAGNIYFVDEVHLRVRRIRPDGVIDTAFNGHSLDPASSPRAVAVDDQSGAVYVADDRPTVFG